MRVLASDPGPEDKPSGLVLLDYERPGVLPKLLEAWAPEPDRALELLATVHADLLVIEEVESFGLGRTDGGGIRMNAAPLLDTARVEGRMLEAWNGMSIHVPRQMVLSYLHVTRRGRRQQQRSSEARVRDALLGLWGGPLRALGCSQRPGPLASCRGAGGHKWSALAVGLAGAHYFHPIRLRCAECRTPRPHHHTARELRRPVGRRSRGSRGRP